MTKKSNTAKPSPEPTLPKFAERLKAIRLEKNWSLRDCEKKTGKSLSRQTVLRAEQGDITLENLFKLFKLFGLKKTAIEELVKEYRETEMSKAMSSS